MRRFLESTGNTRYFNGPTPTHKDSTTVVTQIRKDRLTPQIKHLETIYIYLFILGSSFDHSKDSSKWGERV